MVLFLLTHPPPIDFSFWLYCTKLGTVASKMPVQSTSPPRVLSDYHLVPEIFLLQRNDPLISISPNQNWESPGCFVTCAKVFLLRYFLFRKVCQMPSSFKILNNHLLNKLIFWTSKSVIPRKQTLLGSLKMLHLVRLFLLCSSHC